MDGFMILHASTGHILCHRSYTTMYGMQQQDAEPSSSSSSDPIVASMLIANFICALHTNIQQMDDDSMAAAAVANSNAKANTASVPIAPASPTSSSPPLISMYDPGDGGPIIYFHRHASTATTPTLICAVFLRRALMHGGGARKKTAAFDDDDWESENTNDECSNDSLATSVLLSTLGPLLASSFLSSFLHLYSLPLSVRPFHSSGGTKVYRTFLPVAELMYCSILGPALSRIAVQAMLDAAGGGGAGGANHLSATGTPSTVAKGVPWMYAIHSAAMCAGPESDRRDRHRREAVTRASLAAAAAAASALQGSDSTLNTISRAKRGARRRSGAVGEGSAGSSPTGSGSNRPGAGGMLGVVMPSSIGNFDHHIHMIALTPMIAEIDEHDRANTKSVAKDGAQASDSNRPSLSTASDDAQFAIPAALPVAIPLPPMRSLSSLPLLARRRISTRVLYPFAPSPRRWWHLFTGHSDGDALAQRKRDARAASDFVDALGHTVCFVDLTPAAGTASGRDWKAATKSIERAAHGSHGHAHGHAHAHDKKSALSMAEVSMSSKRLAGSSPATGTSGLHSSSPSKDFASSASASAAMAALPSMSALATLSLLVHHASSVMSSSAEVADRFTSMEIQCRMQTEPSSSSSSPSSPSSATSLMSASSSASNSRMMTIWALRVGEMILCFPSPSSRASHDADGSSNNAHTTMTHQELMRTIGPILACIEVHYAFVKEMNDKRERIKKKQAAANK